MSGFKLPAATAAGFVIALTVSLHAAPSRAWELNLPPATAQGPEAAATAAPAAALPDTAAEEAKPEPPLASPPAASAEPKSHPETLTAEEECLAGAVYFEAKGEPLKGQLSVAHVILNRTKSGRFPRTACGVVRQRGQFSFVHGGRFPPIARASAAWRKAVAVARAARESLARSPAPNALFFHAKRVSPGWRGLTRVAAVGNHVFYR